MLTLYKKFVLGIVFSVILFFFLLSNVYAQSQNFINLYFFYGDGCPHCAQERQYIYESLNKKYPNLNIYEYEIYYNYNNLSLLKEVASTLNIDISGVPFLVIGDSAFVGYAGGITSLEIEEKLEECLKGKCTDQVANIVGLKPSLVNLVISDDVVMPNSDPDLDTSIENLETATSVIEHEENNVVDNSVPESKTNQDNKINIPLLGEISLADFSLPLVTIIMGALDGFNPCAMWTLLFLISLLLGIKNRKRMWLLGSVFIVSSALVYFLFMSAWLNLILFLGFVIWVRMLIGIIAILGGGYSLKEFIFNRDGGCKVAGDEKRKKVFEKMRLVVDQNSLWLALGGIILLAAAVNLVEILCSAGLPAVYTQLLALNQIPTWQYYLYISLYILIFMLDDLFIFFVAMVTLEMTGITTKYARASRLIGGLIMLIIGILIIFKPGWLMF